MLSLQVQDYVRCLKPSATLLINEKMKQLRAEGRAVYHFGFGEAPFYAHSSIQLALNKHSFQKSYLPAQGLPALREAVAEFYQHYYSANCDASQILIGPGSKELLFILLSILEGPLLLPSPRWVSYEPQAHLAKKRVLNLPTLFEEGYKLQPSILENTLKQLPGDQQKILLMNSPTNPTGAVYTRSELISLVEIAKQNNVLIISDEIYGLLTFQSEQFVSLAELYPEGSIVTGGISKDRSLGGYRLGVSLFPKNAKEILQCAIAMATETYSCVAAPIQYAACTAYQLNQELNDYIKRCTQLHEFIVQYTLQKVLGMGLRCVPPQGAFYLFPDFSNFSEDLKNKGIQSDVQLGEDILEKTGVGLLAGSHFGVAGDQFAFRMSPVDYEGHL